MARKRYGNELHPVYTRWMAMKNRCNDPKHPSYKNYGGRGISVSDDLMTFTTFRDYVCSLPNYDPERLTIDRIDSSKGYEIGNLRWKNQSVQIANQRFSGKGFNKYTGVNWNQCKQRWFARITLEGKQLLSCTCVTEKEALDVRNAFIVANGLPHTIQEWSN